MATAQQIWDDVQAKKAAAQQAAADESSAEATMTSKFPEGKSFVFGNVIVEKLHGEIVVLPVTDPNTDLG